MMEVVAGGLAASISCIFTNPMEVVKNRLQLQGELKARGEYVTMYRNPVQGLYTMARTDGLRAVQAGLAPAMMYQLVMNGLRLGCYAEMVNRGWNKGEEGQTSPGRTVICSALAGVVGGIVGSPIFLVKTQLQTSSSPGISVGHQHQHGSMARAFTNLYSAGGLMGLMQGATASVPRISVGSAAQLLTYSTVMEKLEASYGRESHLLNNAIAAFLSGFVVAVVINPFDVISTRIYNQPVSSPLYSSYGDCVSKVVKREGLLAFYKGLTAQYLRIGPHSFLQLILWHHGRRRLGLAEK